MKYLPFESFTALRHAMKNISPILFEFYKDITDTHRLLHKKFCLSLKLTANRYLSRTILLNVYEKSQTEHRRFILIDDTIRVFDHVCQSRV